MSLLPYVFNDVFDDFALRPYYNYRPQQFHVIPHISDLVQSLRQFTGDDNALASITDEKDVFKVNVDVQQFKPEEVNVKIVDDFIVIEGKHEERKDKHGYISRQFTRRYKLPKDVNLEAISSNISSDGILSVVAPKKAKAIAGSNERQIPITHISQPALKRSNENQ